MSHWNAIRIKAAQARREVLESRGLDPDEILPPQDLIDLASEHFNLEICPDLKDSINLQGSVAVLTNGIIFHDHTLAEGYREYCIAHEMGHHVLHRRTDKCSDSDISDFSSRDEAPTAVQEVQGYGSRERREREANLFALEFILPLHVAKKEFLANKNALDRLREVTKLSTSLIFTQLATGLFIPPTVIQETAPPRNVDLDESQASAARAESGPLLISAGPGTGKTQTLVQRVLFLLNEKGIDPERILALTFSNKAAQEMRERIALSAPDKAPKMSVMTFHSYGLELLRKYWSEAGLDADSALIEKLEAILHLERNLDDLNLNHFQSLDDPPAHLPGILSAISRAKDELVGPDEFLEHVRNEQAAAETEEQRERAEKLDEIATVYSFYQSFLTETKQLDYGEILFRAVKLLQSNPGVKLAVQNQYDAILVDEFQDINRASGVLIKEIAGDGKGLWAVGDLRQSIYRWRGASSQNIKQFENDYAGAKTLSLCVNYRSGREVVDFFSSFAQKMTAVEEPSFEGWNVNSDKSAEVHYHFAEDIDAEIDFIADEIRRNCERGITYKQQAVICRTNPQLSKIAEKLSEREIPVFYLGELFERREIKDLLALLEVRSSDKGFGLVRLASMPEYAMSLEDVPRVMEAAAADPEGFQSYISSESVPEGMSEEGKKGLAAIRSDLADISRDSSAFSALGNFIFAKRNFIDRLMTGSSDSKTAQDLLAVFQFLNLAKSLEDRFYDPEAKSEQIEKFLMHIRRLITFGEDTSLFQIPESAQALDAVRILTVHKSKGLEFEVVYLPYLGKGQFPFKDKPEKYPLPTCIPSVDKERMEEEECLFFVAMSRARLALHLSRSNKPSDPSPFFEKLEQTLPQEKFHKAKERVPPTANSATNPGFNVGELFISEIERYGKCPRQFYYRNVLKLQGKNHDSVYSKFYKTVQSTISDIHATLKKNETVDEDSALAKLDVYWDLGEMENQPYAKIYRKRAEDMIRVIVSRIGETRSEIVGSSLRYQFDEGTISVRPHHLENISPEEGVLIRNFLTKKQPDADKRVEYENDEVVLTLAARKDFSDRPVRIIRTYLVTDSDLEINVTDQVIKNRTVKFNEAFTSIRNGEFPTVRNDFNCYKCSYYFICEK